MPSQVGVIPPAAPSPVLEAVSSSKLLAREVDVEGKMEIKVKVPGPARLRTFPSSLWPSPCAPSQGPPVEEKIEAEIGAGVGEEVGAGQRVGT